MTRDSICRDNSVTETVDSVVISIRWFFTDNDPPKVSHVSPRQEIRIVHLIVKNAKCGQKRTNISDNNIAGGEEFCSIT